MKLPSIQNRIVRYEARCRPLARLLLVALLQLLAAPASVAQQYFSIPAGVLADALDRFSEQSGLQTVHASTQIQELQTSRVEGDYSPAAVLDLLLEGSGLAWQQVDEHTILVGPPSRTQDQPAPAWAVSRGSGSNTGLVGHPGLCQHRAHVAE